MFSKPLFRYLPMKTLVKNYIPPTLEPILPLQHILTSTAYPNLCSIAYLYNLSYLYRKSCLYSKYIWTSTTYPNWQQSTWSSWDFHNNLSSAWNFQKPFLNFSLENFFASNHIFPWLYSLVNILDNLVKHPKQFLLVSHHQLENKHQSCSNRLSKWIPIQVKSKGTEPEGTCHHFFYILGTEDRADFHSWHIICD